MKKYLKLLAGSIFFLSALTLNAQVKSYVGVIREQLYPESISYLEGLKEDLKNDGYSTYSNYIDSYLNGGFGSGFVYVAADGTNYVITNRHVVNHAKTASIEFEDSETGAVTKFENLYVFATDDDIDIAILKFENGKNPFKKGLSFSAAKITDGMDVWSAGFPGLGKAPMWQLGKGTVTNSSARIKELLDPSISTIIQHSAEIDGGNSGGPLMISSSKGTDGYEVIGVNTWKAAYRQNTNFAIPVKVISDFIKNSNTASNPETVAKTRAEKFISALNDKNGDFTSIAKFISYESASKNGKKNLEAALKYASSDARAVIVNAFSYSPVEGLKYATAYRLWEKYSVKATEGTAFALQETKKNAESYTFSMKNDAADKTLNLTLKNEHGLWRLDSLLADGETEETEEKSKSKSKSKTKTKQFADVELLEPVYKLDFFGGVTKDFDGDKLGFHLGFDYWGIAEDYICYTINFVHQPFMEDAVNSLGMGFGARLPLNFSQSFGLQPFAKLNLNFGGFDSRFMIGYSAEIGIEGIINREWTVKPALGVTLNYSKHKEFMNMDHDFGSSPEIDCSIGSLKFYVKLAF